MTLRERVAQWQAQIEQEPRDIPDDWDAGLVHGTVGGAAAITWPGTDQISGLSAVLNGDPEADRKTEAMLRASVWQALELCRLGQTDQLRNLGVLR